MLRQLAIGSCLLALVPAALKAEPDSDVDRLERLERAVQLLQERNAELAKEVRELKATRKSAPPPKPPKENVAAHPSEPAAAATDAKAAVEQKEIKETKKPVTVIAGASELKLTLGGFIQAQFEGGDALAFEGRLGSGEINSRFRIRRARINVTGDYAEAFDFKLEGEFASNDTGITVRDAAGRTLASNSTRTSFAGLDLWANWHRFPEFQIKVGQYKAPFGLEQLSADTKLFTPERSLVTTSLTPERQIGVQLWGKPLTNLWPEQKDLINYAVGVFNGTGRNITVNDNNEFMYAGRIEVQALKTKILNGDVSLKFGANGFTSRDDAGNAISSVLRENSDGSLTTFNLPSAAERTAYGFDASFHFGPFDFIAEYLSERVGTRTVNGIAPLFNGFRADGYYLQGSYFVLPNRLQLVAKWESFDPNQFADDNIHSITAGVNYLIKGDDVKILAHYIHTWSDFREHLPGVDQSEFDEAIVRLQVVF
jgi:phosphate-selective porin